MSDFSDLHLRFWGVRGSIACSRDQASRYGSNTPCIEVRCGEHLVIFDAGTGIVNLDGTEISDGLIELKTGTGSVAKVKFYCESGNAHAQTLQAAPHSAASTAVLVLPTASGLSLIHI